MKWNYFRNALHKFNKYAMINYHILKSNSSILNDKWQFNYIRMFKNDNILCAYYIKILEGKTVIELNV